MNPLLQHSSLKNSAVPFHLIKPEHFPQALDHAIALGQKTLMAIRTQPASFDNTLRALEACSEELEYIFTLFNNLLAAHSNEELQKLSMELGPRVASFANDIWLDVEVFAKVATVHQQRASLKLNSEQLRLVEKVYRDFQRSGAALPPEKKTRLRAIDERLSQLNPKFRENVLKATNTFELWIDDEKDLAGLGPTQVTAAREAATERGQDKRWLFTLPQPSSLPFLKFADNRLLREKMFRAYHSRAFGGPYDNQPVIRETVDLLHEKSELLGANSYAEYALQLRMAESPKQVHEFLQRLLTAAKPAAVREVAEVQELAQSLGGPVPLQPWDFLYYSEKLKEKKYAFDEDSLRPYFKLENVLDGVFELAGRLYNLEFKASNEYPVYHPDVRVFEVYKSTPDKAFIGLFYTDFFPRASKSQGAWMTNFCEQGLFRSKLVRPHVSIVCNFTTPTTEQPSLLTFDEVSTLFHEFGHGLHSLLSQVEFRSLAGTNVYLDFVELPSQIFENWAEEIEALSLFAFHYQTGELIPLQLMERMKAAQKFQVGYTTMRQVNFALLDLAWFSAPASQEFSVPDFENRVTAECRLLPQVPGTNISASFAHIFGGGYASGYYSYKWAEALDADAFELFRERGIFNQEVAGKFEEFILSKGASDHPLQLYKKFRGRAPDPEALLRRDGLL